ncbi:hypothetical protein E8E14_008024 [Neopestalotiopsis sp. 37M]|nr:hypothetical protein E8E14_008024 [Neopestalotiopsis sp. 37M]
MTGGSNSITHCLPSTARRAIRLPYPRTKSGCLTCRNRRKKCDGTRPIYSACAQRHLACAWPGGRKAPRNRATQIVVPHPPGPSGLGDDIDHDDDELTVIGQLPVSLLQQSTPDSIVSDENTTTDDPLRIARSPPSSRDWLNPNIMGTKISLVLLEYYITETALILSTRNGTHNPYLSLVLSLATRHELLASSILVLAGVHMVGRTKSKDITIAAWGQYDYIVTMLKISGQSFGKWSVLKQVHTLLIMLLLYIAEIFNGSSDGSDVLHLKACRWLVAQLLEISPDDMDGETRALKDFVVETYTYHAFVATITPFGLDAKNHQTLLPHSTNFQSSHTSSYLFAEYSGLLGLISSINGMYWERRRAVQENKDL